MEGERQRHFRTLLDAERDRLSHLSQRMGETGLDASQGDSLSELSTYDNHPADIGSETFERSKDMAVRGSLETRLRDVEEALGRLDAGTYGVCQVCGRAIDEERLQAMPETPYCKECRQRVEREESVHQRVRPAEEDRLSPPFGRSFLDQNDREWLGYDGEDAWQDVAQYGTSETPQDVPDSAGYDRLYQDAREARGAVEPVEALVDEAGEPLQDEDYEEDDGRGRRR